MRPFRIIALVAVAALSLLGVMDASHTSVAAAGCTRLASNSGSDSASGAPGAPWRTVGKLLASLQPGDVGCLAGGQSFGDPATKNTLEASGVTLQSAPGSSPAALVGELKVSGSHDVVQGLVLDGRNALGDPSNPAASQGAAGLYVVGNDVTVQSNDISNGHTAICVYLGDDGFKISGAVIDGNRVHACGVLPATSLQHGIYAHSTQGATISNNVLYDIADWGIQVYPDATDTMVVANLIDTTGHGGVVIGSEGGTPTSGTRVTRNIITRSGGYPIKSYWGGAVGSDNVASDNCIAGNGQRQDDTWAGLSVQSLKVVADAGFDAQYMLNPGSACLGYGPASIQPGAAATSGAGATAPAAVTTTPATAAAAAKGAAHDGGASVRGGHAVTVALSAKRRSTARRLARDGIVAVVSRADSRSGSRLVAVKVRWLGRAKATYRLRLDDRRWLRVRGVVHTFERLPAGKHVIAVRALGVRAAVRRGTIVVA